MKSLYNLLVNRGTTGAFVFGIVVIGISVALIVSGINSSGYDMGTDLNQVLKGGTDDTFDFFNFALGIPVIMVILAFGVALLFGIVQIAKNPKGSLKSLVGVAVVLGLFAVFYSMAIPETAGRLGMLHGKFDIGETASKLISGGIKTTLTLLVGAVVFMFGSMVLNLFK